MNNPELDRTVNFPPEAPHAAADDPCLPGFEKDDERSAPQKDAQPGGTETSAQDADGAPISPCGIGRFACFAVIVALAAIAVIAAARLIKPRTIVREVVQEVQTEPDGIPLALLPDTADASVWPVVANMSGTLGGTPLTFRRGVARVNGIDYKVCLDFCRSGGDIYVRIAGPAAWIVRVNAAGKILKAYPAPKNNRPLKSLFAK